MGVSSSALTQRLDARAVSSPRWFTPASEVDLCGHATLATAHVLVQERGEARERLVFHTVSGELSVTLSDGGYELDFPSRPARPVAAPAEVRAGRAS